MDNLAVKALAKMNKHLLDYMKTRRSGMAMTMEGTPPNQAEIREMIAIASRVPDHGKLTPWRFITFTRADRNKIAALLKPRLEASKDHPQVGKWEKELERFTGPPLVIAVVSRAAPHEKVPEWEQLLSVGASCQNLLIAANALGFEAQWLTGWYCYDREALTLLGLKPDENLAGVIHIGKSDIEKQDRPRPQIDDVLSAWTAPSGKR